MLTSGFALFRFYTYCSNGRSSALYNKSYVFDGVLSSINAENFFAEIVKQMQLEKCFLRILPRFILMNRLHFMVEIFFDFVLFLCAIYFSLRIVLCSFNF